MENGYKKSLSAFMNFKWVALGLVTVCIGIIYFIYTTLPSELAPMEDRNQFRLSVTAPEGTSYDYMDSYMDTLSQFLEDSIPEKTMMISLTSPGFGGGSINSGFFNVMLTDPQYRNRSQQDVVNMVNRNLKKFPQGRAFASQQQTISTNRHGGQPIAICNTKQ